jgi:DNA repair exonuclease SbcCD ATPase subunit
MYVERIGPDEGGLTAGGADICGTREDLERVVNAVNEIEALRAHVAELEANNARLHALADSAVDAANEVRELRARVGELEARCARMAAALDGLVQFIDDIRKAKNCSYFNAEDKSEPGETAYNQACAALVAPDAQTGEQALSAEITAWEAANKQDAAALKIFIQNERTRQAGERLAAIRAALEAREAIRALDAAKIVAKLEK